MKEKECQKTGLPLLQFQFLKAKGDIINCGMHRGVKLLEHAMKIVEKVLEKRLGNIATIDDMQFVSMPGKGTIDAVFILRRIQEEYVAKQRKLYMCIMYLEKAFDRVPRKVEKWVMRKKGIPETLVTAVMSLYKGAKTKVKVGTHFFDKSEINVEVHQVEFYHHCCLPL